MSGSRHGFRRPPWRAVAVQGICVVATLAPAGSTQLGPSHRVPAGGSVCGPGPLLAPLPRHPFRANVLMAPRAAQRTLVPVSPCHCPLFLGAEPSSSRGLPCMLEGRLPCPPSSGSPRVMVQTDLTCSWNRGATQLSLKPQALTVHSPAGIGPQGQA